MADAFLGDTKTDRDFALQSQGYLQENLGITTFMAEVSLAPGEVWPDRVWNALMASRVAIFLMSRAACRSPSVNQEFGGARSARARLIPVVWDMDPSELPGWIAQHQALDLRDKHESYFAEQLERIAKDIKMDKVIGAAVLTAFAGFVIWGRREGG